MLTLMQALAIKTRTLRPPWRASQLASPSSARSISLRPLVNAVGEQRILIFLRVRQLAVLVNRKTWNELKSVWKDPAPSSADFHASLKTLSKALPAGASIVYVSTDGQTVGVSGTINAFSSVKGVTLTKEQGDAQIKGLEDTAQGLGALAAAEGILLAGALAGGEFLVLGVIVASVAFVAAGLILGVGIGQLADGYCPIVSKTVQSDSAGSTPGPVSSAPVLGEIPSDLPVFGVSSATAESLLLQLLYLDLTDIPDAGILPGAGDLAPGTSGVPDLGGSGGFGSGEG